MTHPPSSPDAVQNAPSTPTILHISGDYPDPFDSAKTPVIKTLLELTKDRFAHEVISINRQSPRLSQLARCVTADFVEERPFEGGIAVRYLAPPRGLLHHTMLSKLAGWIEQRIEGLQTRPQLLVGHKLTIEGLATRRVARRLEIPYVLCIQGDTDTKIISFRPDLSREYSKVLRDAAMVFPFTPWALQRILRRLDLDDVPHRMLPCATDIDVPLPPTTGTRGLVSIFHLRNFKRKNLAGLAQAMRLLEGSAAEIPNLSVIGGGDAHQIAQCSKIIASVPKISLLGPMNRDEIRLALNQATAFILPSLRETFGLVFIESLFAGVPIIYPRGAAVDGYFEGKRFAIPVNARDPKSIAQAIEFACRNESELKAELAEWQKSEHMRQFTREAISQEFAEGLQDALSGCSKRERAGGPQATGARGA